MEKILLAELFVNPKVAMLLVAYEMSAFRGGRVDSGLRK